MRTIRRYLLRLFAMRVLGVAAVLVALLEIMDLVDSVGDVLERRNSMADLFIYVGYRLPTIIESVIPISVLLGAIAFFLALAGRSEVDALHSAGLSQTRLVVLCLPVCFAIMAVHFVLIDRVVPASQQAFVEWWEPPVNRGDVLWMRGGDSIVSVAGQLDGATELDEVTIYRRDDTGRLIARVTAATATFDGTRWSLNDVSEQIFDGAGGTELRQHATLPWPEGPVPDTIGMLQQTPDRLPTNRLTGLLSAPWSGATETASYRTELIRRYAAPMATLVMIMLATPAMRRRGRSAAAMAGAMLGLALGLSFVVVDGILTALGRAGLVAPWLAAWSAPILFAVIGLILMRQSET